METKGRRSLCKEGDLRTMVTKATNDTFDLSIEGEKIKICPFEWPNLSWSPAESSSPDGEQGSSCGKYWSGPLLCLPNSLQVGWGVGGLSVIRDSGIDRDFSHSIERENKEATSTSYTYSTRILYMVNSKEKIKSIVCYFGVRTHMSFLKRHCSETFYLTLFFNQFCAPC
jgi:hypothetical protein